MLYSTSAEGLIVLIILRFSLVSCRALPYATALGLTVFGKDVDLIAALEQHWLKSKWRLKNV